jgi:hypothetical protein
MFKVLTLIDIPPKEIVALKPTGILVRFLFHHSSPFDTYVNSSPNFLRGAGKAAGMKSCGVESH